MHAGKGFQPPLVLALQRFVHIIYCTIVRAYMRVLNKQSIYLPHVRHVHSFVNVLGRNSDSFVRPNPSPDGDEVPSTNSVKVAWNRGFTKSHFWRKWRNRICHTFFVVHFRLFSIGEFAQGLERTMHRTLIGSLLLTDTATWRMEITKG